MNLFTRSELRKITGLTLSQIATAEEYGIITPLPWVKGRQLYGYAWGDLLELMAYARLRETLTIRTITQAVDTLSTLKLSDKVSLSDKRLLVYGELLLWIEDTADTLGSTIIELTGKNPGQTVFTFTYSDLLEEIWDKGSVIHDFETRAEDTPRGLAVA